MGKIITVSDNEASKIKLNKKELEGFRKFEEFIKDLERLDKDNEN